MSAPYKDFGEALAKQRRERGYTQNQVATALGVSLSTYARWEQGRNRPSLGSMRLLARADFDLR